MIYLPDSISCYYVTPAMIIMARQCYQSQAYITRLYLVHSNLMHPMGYIRECSCWTNGIAPFGGCAPVITHRVTRYLVTHGSHFNACECI